MSVRHRTHPGRLEKRLDRQHRQHAHAEALPEGRARLGVVHDLRALHQFDPLNRTRGAQAELTGALLWRTSFRKCIASVDETQ